MSSAVNNGYGFVLLIRLLSILRIPIHIGECDILCRCGGSPLCIQMGSAIGFHIAHSIDRCSASILGSIPGIRGDFVALGSCEVKIVQALNTYGTSGIPNVITSSNRIAKSLLIVSAAGIVRMVNNRIRHGIIAATTLFRTTSGTAASVSSVIASEFEIIDPVSHCHIAGVIGPFNSSSNPPVTSRKIPVANNFLDCLGIVFNKLRQRRNFILDRLNILIRLLASIFANDPCATCHGIKNTNRDFDFVICIAVCRQYACWQQAENHDER